MPEVALLLFALAGLVFFHQALNRKKSLHLIGIGYIILIAAYLVLHKL